MVTFVPVVYTELSTALSTSEAYFGPVDKSVNYHGQTFVCPLYCMVSQRSLRWSQVHVFDVFLLLNACKIPPSVCSIWHVAVLLNKACLTGIL